MEPITAIIASALVGKGLYNVTSASSKREGIRATLFKSSDIKTQRRNTNCKYLLQYKVNKEKKEYVKCTKFYDYRYESWSNIRNYINYELFEVKPEFMVSVSDNENFNKKTLPYSQAIRYAMDKYGIDITKDEFSSSNILIKEKECEIVYLYGKHEEDGKFKADIVSDNMNYLLDELTNKPYIAYMSSGCGFLFLSLLFGNI
ncbi:Transmembrane domain-containing protein [Orpheovirus IHUMI-LCC2]|uniref:Transmembrane domain-containing protein n=1 Tax=Orpheovirus IHUMI-LCC2 TaxID=2023057 RepID=A0A2I2L4A0_9VIRU|nr:Transmembrane domain-containing protein [Orpheovirus IHUMI-LCC2]SNW62366.1 Transmembrane domain-containing protein [Orpheovirus IHUMI-LCC2]